MSITKTECYLECHEGHCVITAKNICGHPLKGALQPTEMKDSAVKERRRLARLAIAKQEAAEQEAKFVKTGL
jgi:hypothetical protein